MLPEEAPAGSSVYVLAKQMRQPVGLKLRISTAAVCLECTLGLMCGGLQVAMDTAQYQLDMAAVQDRQAEDVYSTFNLLMRRKPKVPAQSIPIAIALEHVQHLHRQPTCST